MEGKGRGVEGEKGKLGSMSHYPGGFQMQSHGSGGPRAAEGEPYRASKSLLVSHELLSRWPEKASRPAQGVEERPQQWMGGAVSYSAIL